MGRKEGIWQEREEEKVILMDEEEVTAYKCTICGTLYLDEQEATDCHGNSMPVDAYTCGRCGTIYEEREEARKCDSPL